MKPVPNLRWLAEVLEHKNELLAGMNLRNAGELAEIFAFDLSSLLDGEEGDVLAEILVPIRDFLKKLAGIS